MGDDWRTVKSSHTKVSNESEKIRPMTSLDECAELWRRNFESISPILVLEDEEQDSDANGSGVTNNLVRVGVIAVAEALLVEKLGPVSSPVLYLPKVGATLEFVAKTVDLFPLLSKQVFSLLPLFFFLALKTLPTGLTKLRRENSLEMGRKEELGSKTKLRFGGNDDNSKRLQLWSVNIPNSSSFPHSLARIETLLDIKVHFFPPL